MSERVWTYRIRHMLQAIEEIQTYTTGMDEEGFYGNQQVQRAVERCFEIIGEAATRLPPPILKQYPDIPWSKIKGMRHFVIHEYDRVLENVLWTTIRNDLGNLQEQLKSISLPDNE